MPRVECEIVVEAPADSVYQVWRNFENFPNFMSNIEEVRDSGAGRSHWRAKGPFGRDAEWDAEITRDEPARCIEWRSLQREGDNVRTEGSVEFESMGDATRVCVMLEYEAPGGGAGEIITKIFANPGKHVEEDLVRFKEAMETNGGYDRVTERIANVNTSDAEERAVKQRYPADTYEPGGADDTRTAR